jgi:hypothetical protein
MVELTGLGRLSAVAGATTLTTALDARPVGVCGFGGGRRNGRSGGNARYYRRYSEMHPQRWCSGRVVA